MLLIGGVTPALGQAPATESVEQGATPMDQMEMANPQPGQPLVPAPAKPQEWWSSFINDSKFSAQLRTFYFNRDKFDNTRSEAWAIGGWVGFKSGYLADFFRLGAVAYTSQPLYAPDGRDGTLLLQPGQDGYTVLGQIYGEIKFTDRIFGAFGRKEYDTPYINRNDTRMTPNTFEGVTVYGKAGGENGTPAWRFGGGYISKIKEKNSDDFVWMSRDAGAAVDRGVYVGGANVEFKGFSFGAIDYYSDDIINIFYTETSYKLAMPDGYKLNARRAVFPPAEHRRQSSYRSGFLHRPVGRQGGPRRRRGAAYAWLTRIRRTGRICRAPGVAIRDTPAYRCRTSTGPASRRSC